jgi:elongator complex protein 1
MRNLKLQRVTNHPHLFPPIEPDPNDVNYNYLITSRDGKSIVAISFRTIDDENGDKNKKCVHFCKTVIGEENVLLGKEHTSRPISLLNILQDAEEEEVQSVLNSPPIGALLGCEEEDGDEFGDILDMNSVNTIIIGISSGHLIKIRWLVQGNESELSSNHCLDVNTNATIIGSFDDGLVSMCRSPDEELVVAVSGGLQGKGQQVIVMSSEFDLLVERPLDPEFDGSEQAVNVGWGAKETQFHGRAGKSAAKAKSDMTLSAVLDDGLINIVWREDCQFFAISHMSKRSSNEENMQLRRIRIFDREGTLLHTSEPVGGLESGRPFAWKPSGSLIAGTVRKPNGKYVVSFFEKNGLMHGEFEIRLPSKSCSSKIVVTHLEWNKDSTVLMVVSRDVSENTYENNKDQPTGQYYIQLWTVSNYRWHLKQCLTYETPIIFQEWASVLPDGSQHPLVLNVVTSDGRFRSYRYGWKIDCSGENLPVESRNSSDKDLANVAVIDGCMVKVTPFSQTVIPPPISAYELHFQNEIRQVIFPTSCPYSINQMLVVTTNNHLIMCKVEKKMHLSACTEDTGAKQIKVTGCGGQGFSLKCDILRPEPFVYRLCDNLEGESYSKESFDEISNYCVLVTHRTDKNGESYSIIAAKGNKLLVYRIPSLSNASGLNKAEASTTTNENANFEVTNCILTSSHLCESQIFNISSIALSYKNNDIQESADDLQTCQPTNDEAVIQLDNGTLLLYHPDGDTLDPFKIDGSELRLAARCTKISVLQSSSDSLSNSDYARKVLSLSEKNRLYLNNVEIATGVTSYFVHTHFLLITTLQHTLRSLPLESLFKKVITSETKNELWITESTRALERGSRIVVAVPPPDTKVVLQMPRGNLEVIHPRALSLHIVKTLLDDCNFKLAMEIFRRQRINQNLIVDHNPGHFIKHVRDFVAQVSNQSIQRLCLFVADLIEEDCTVTMFKSMYSTLEGNELEHQTTAMHKSPFWNTSKNGKIWSVCSSLLNVFENDTDKYFLPIISCLVKRSSSDSKSMLPQGGSDGIEEALLRIQSMRSSNSQLAEEALSFLSLLVLGEGGGGDRLFDSALGVYDFDLVLFVAEKASQKDPKEYLPFLNELKMLPQGGEYRKYRIDLYLKRYRSALDHIVKHITEDTHSGDQEMDVSKEEDEFLNLVKEQRLYCDAIRLLTAVSSQYHVAKINSRLSIAYADYLFSKKYYEDAALMYESGKDIVNAISAWEKSGNWSYCLALATNEKMTGSEFEDICRRLVERLKGNIIWGAFYKRGHRPISSPDKIYS